MQTLRLLVLQLNFSNKQNICVSELARIQKPENIMSNSTKSMIPFEFQPKWLIRSGFQEIKYDKPDVLYKYLDQVYIDRFFETGEIKLGTYNSFSKTEDKYRTDYQEGTHEYVVWNKNRTHKWTLRRMTGGHNVIYCTSASNEFEKLTRKFNCNGYFKIINSLGFAYALAKSIKGFQLGLEGPAIYTETGQTNFYTEKYKVDDFTNDTPVHEIFKTFDVISKINFDLYFSKRSDDYKDENEYRFVWLLDHEPSEDEQIINCPNALQYCQKIT